MSHNALLRNDARWENLTLHCCKCKEQIGGFHFRVILYYGETDLIEHVSEESNRFILQAISEHDCLRKTSVAPRKVIALDSSDPVFKVNQWVINMNTGALHRITDQVLADLMNEQRGQGINHHLKPYL